MELVHLPPRSKYCHTYLRGQNTGTLTSEVKVLFILGLEVGEEERNLLLRLDQQVLQIQQDRLVYTTTHHQLIHTLQMIT